MTASDHILMPKLKDQLASGKMHRREFIRFATLLGVSAGAAYALAGSVSPAMAADNLPFPAADPNAKAGGILRVGQRVAKMEDPSTYSWNEMSNQSRPIIEYMTLIDPDNVVRPMLLESWEASDDLKTWTLHVRKGVMWHNGEELTADHLAFNILRWTDSATGSSTLGLSTFAALATPTGEMNEKGKPIRKPSENGVEVVDKHTLKLNLSTPVLSVAEDCAEYPALIVHPSFQAPFSTNPIGTGPYTLAELKVSDRCVLKRVTQTTDGKEFKYWGGDVFLDEIHFYNYDQENQTAALASGTVDAIYELTVEQLELAKSIEGAKILQVETAQTLCCRMQVDQKPFDDIRVRQAMVKAADNAAIKALVFPEGGAVAANFHVSPVHPEYFPMPDTVQDIEGAKALLAEAGYADGIDLSIDVGNTDGPWHQAVCEALRDQLQAAGIRLAVNVLPTTKFWEIWDKTPFGATPGRIGRLARWVLPRPTAPACRGTKAISPTLNSTRRWPRRKPPSMWNRARPRWKRCEKILQDAAVMVQPFWRPIYNLASSKVNGYMPHPARQMQLTRVWMSA